MSPHSMILRISRVCAFCASCGASCAYLCDGGSARLFSPPPAQSQEDKHQVGVWGRLRLEEDHSLACHIPEQVQGNLQVAGHSQLEVGRSQLEVVHNLLEEVRSPLVEVHNLQGEEDSLLVVDHIQLEEERSLLEEGHSPVQEESSLEGEGL